MPSTFDAAVIIPHYNDSIRLLRCLDALMPMVSAVNATAAPRVEVVVVDNNSTENLDIVRTAYPDLRIVIERKEGAASARNRGVRETTAPHLFFIDSDCVASTGWLQTALKIAPQADLIGGRVTVFDETSSPRSGTEAFETVFAFNFRHYVEKKGFSGTGNLLTRRDVFEAVGDFIPGLSEDLNWCHRATAQGFRLIYSDDLQVAHPTRSDWPALERKWRRITKESWGLEGRSSIARLRWSARALAMLPSIVAHVPRVLASPALNGPGERLAAVGTLARLRLLRCGWMLAQAVSRNT